jgi:hypothetical protein
MKIFTQGIFARRKIVFLFLLAILLPSLVVGYLSFKTFSEKQKAVQNFMESNLWISGESALKTIENELLDLEESIIKKENFGNKLRSMDATSRSEGRSFLLGDNLEIVIPQIARFDGSNVEGGIVSVDSQFSQAFKAAFIHSRLGSSKSHGPGSHGALFISF